jgi:outer membrane protein assembly factor BamB
LNIIVIDPDEKKVAAFRQELIAAGLYGKRVAVHAGDPVSFSLPAYLANLMISEDLAAAGIETGAAFVQKAFGSLRPFGGVAWLPVPENRQKDFTQLVTDAELAGAKVHDGDGYLLLVREGALPGSANWTHEHADPANTRVSKDKLVKAPLGVLWFGGPSNEGILPRHGHGPQPQVIDGKLLIEGVNMLRCMDIYTGRILWETKLPGVGNFYNNLAHQPGANASGTNYISASDGVYIVYGKACLKLDLESGKRLAEFALPMLPGMKEAPLWGYINVHEDYLIAGSAPLHDPKLFKPILDTKLNLSDEDKKPEDKPDPNNPLSKLLGTITRGANDNMSASKHLVVMDRHTGKVLWTATAENWFRHNATCTGGGRLYSIDRLSGAQLDRMKRLGQTPTTKSALRVFDIKTGKELWSTDQNVFGTWLSYSAQHDVLMESGRRASDTLNDEPSGMRAYQADTGKVMWYKSYLGPAMIQGDTILMAGSACNLLTGAPKMRIDPITNQQVEWKWIRTYGCNTPAASEHLLTFRSGAAGYFDLCNDGGTGNFGGFRSSCTNNLIVAGGILTAPDYTRTCTCAYQNQTSLALIHMPEAEMWTYFGSMPVREAIRRVGVNFGAPGDRKSLEGTLWLEYPSVGGVSPVVPVRLGGTTLQYFRRHSSRVEGELPWVAASGVKGLSSLTIARGLDPGTLYALESLGQAFAPAPAGPAFFPAALGQIGLSPFPEPDKKRSQKPHPERTYTLRLYFAEPDDLKPGERVFTVAVQGQEILKDFDIVKEAGGPNRSLVKEIKGVKMTRDLILTFTPSGNATVKVPLICGLEMIAEGW